VIGIVGRLREFAWQFRRAAALYGAAAAGRMLASMIVAGRLGRGRTIPVRVPGLPAPIWLRAQTTDVRVFDQLFIRTELALALRDAPASIVDAGANIGLAALWLARRYPGARIVALEVEAGNYAMLQRNTAAYPNIEARQVGLWSRPATLAVAAGDAGEGGEWGFVVTEVPPDTPGAIPATDVASLVDGFGGRIDLLKIDIEGSEVEVFSSGAERWIDRIGVIAVEPHDAWAPGGTAAIRRAAGTRFDESRCGEYLVLSRPHGASHR
jgi:FkbM family methyltransferase